MDDQTTEVVVIPSDAIVALTQLAREHYVQLEIQNSRGFEPVSMVVATVVGGTAAVGTVLHLIDRSKGGQMVDCRPGAERTVYRTPDVVYGLVVCVAVDGTVTVEVKEPRGIFGQVAELVAATSKQFTGKPAEAVASEIRGLFVENTSVSVTHRQGS